MAMTEVQSTALLAETGSRPSSSPSPTFTEIAGYRLQERIGVGGFGEVWRAIGPGGFTKAVKILFGNLNGPQAELELRSLNRIRELRHPFLLNVERVEIVDDRVVIVTELADRSLEDRFREAVAAGQKGVPRAELIGYLRDAADALDFMAEQHELQHLDVKPDNLLLQGTHAKVGDFGLTKSLEACGHSLVNGFTPLYAPPELFDGRPERGSDQYSLAIVYQTMLTGVPPFNGRSAAQLTSQHLKSPPDLSALHPSDRPIVARALSKSPRTRFPDCRQFVDELSRRRYVNSSLPRVSAPADAATTNSLTHFVESGTAGLNKSRLLPPAIPLRPPDTKGLNWQVRPTLFVAIGGSGTLVLAQLRERITSRFPNAAIPALGFVCIDADVESLQAIERRSATSSPTSLKCIGVPLKTSHEYRKKPGEHLNWLSRRWLFNIPRSGKVEGMRPLGRLAFVDHQDKIRTQLQQSIDHIVKSGRVEESAEQTQLPFTRDALDLVVVGSTSGGTCSGSLLDAVGMIRTLLAERRLPPCRLSAVLMHGTGNSGPSADMQDANTISFLKELNYLSLPGVRQTSRNGSGVLLDDAVLLHMGDDLTSVDFQNGLATVTDYLELRTLTPAGLEMDSWQADERRTADHAAFSLRTLGLAKVTSETWDVASSEANVLSAGLIHQWMISAAAAESGVSDSASPAFLSLLAELSLKNDAVVELVPRLLNSERGRRVDEYAAGIGSRMDLNAAPGEIPGLLASLIGQEAASPGMKSAIADVIEEIRNELSERAARSLEVIGNHFETCFDNRERLAGARLGFRRLLTAFDGAITTSARQKEDLQRAFRELCSSFSDKLKNGAANADGNTLKSFCRQYCMLLVCQTISQHVVAHMTSLRDGVARLKGEQINRLAKQLQTISALIHNASKAPPVIAMPMLTAFEESLLRSGRFRLSQLLQRDASPADAAILSSEAANFLFKSVGKSSTPAADDPSGIQPEFTASARPFLRNVGGGQRVLAAIPEQIPAEPWKSRLQEEFGACVSVCQMNRTDISVICEVEGIAVSAVVDTLSNLKPKVVELASRVHSRQDIPW